MFSAEYVVQQAGRECGTSMHSYNYCRMLSCVGSVHGAAVVLQRPHVWHSVGTHTHAHIFTCILLPVCGTQAALELNVTDAKGMGRIIGHLKKKVGSGAPGAKISAAVKKALDM